MEVRARAPHLVSLFSEVPVLTRQKLGPPTPVRGRVIISDLPRGSTTHQAGGPDRGDYPQQDTLLPHLNTGIARRRVSAPRKSEQLHEAVAYTSITYGADREYSGQDSGTERGNADVRGSQAPPNMSRLQRGRTTSKAAAFAGERARIQSE